MEWVRYSVIVTPVVDCVGPYRAVAVECRGDMCCVLCDPLVFWGEFGEYSPLEGLDVVCIRVLSPRALGKVVFGYGCSVIVDGGPIVGKVGDNVFDVYIRVSEGLC